MKNELKNNTNNSINGKNIISQFHFNNHPQILYIIFNNENINSLLYDIFLPLLQGIVLNYYTLNEINTNLSKSIFILAYAFSEQYFIIFNNIMASKIIKQFYSDDEINNIKYYFEQLNNIQIENETNGENNNNGYIYSYFNIFREKFSEFVKKIQNIIVSRKKEINSIDLNDENILD